MKSLYSSYVMTVDRAYIIRIKGHESSERLANEAAKSCASVGMPYQFWDAYNGIENPIKPPENHHPVMGLIKITDHYLTRGEVACALSHISLWVKCIEDDRPIVVLEHDAKMMQAYRQHGVYNSICYLGCFEQALQNKPILPTPPHGSEGNNIHFICRAHAYAIDPAVAKNLLAHVIKYGITAPLDIFIRADIFPIHQMGLYATDGEDKTQTTILGRPEKGRRSQLNHELTV